MINYLYIMRVLTDLLMKKTGCLAFILIFDFLSKNKKLIKQHIKQTVDPSITTDGVLQTIYELYYFTELHNKAEVMC